MKIYFAGSIRAGRGDVGLYSKIVSYLKNYGKVLTSHVADESIGLEGEDNMEDRNIYKRDYKWLLECDVMIAEVSIPSLGVGYEIAVAVEKGKKVLCLYSKRHSKKLSGMIAGCPHLKVIEYKDFEEIKKAIDKFFQKDNK